MTKLVQVLVRRDEYSHEAFVDWWRGDHAELASELPGLKRYSTSVPTNPDYVDYDGVLALTFESAAALDEAFESEIGQEVQADAADYVDFDAGSRMIVEETVHVDEG
ncbi:EthD family reductase [Natronococcus wangiae]|uniref:EthD family reductase n=1 Tax=Natronococcus wangiae TaxID=3068275 RepID=UPI00273D6E5B|nr:EthD family reductase [Natronococcus sp. AD5]